MYNRGGISMPAIHHSGCYCFSYTGTISDLIELVSLAKRVIKPGIGGHFKLDQATEALTMLTKSKIIGRDIINP